jgi:hypothetical protein
MKRYSISVLFALLILRTSAFAEVYKYTNKQGVVTYTTSKPTESAKPAVLPNIMREKKTAGPVTLGLSCTSHGGINCQAGPDEDGSVICLDGFKNAVARFKFRCSSTKLSVVELEPAADQLSVWVRNEKDVTAENVRISMLLPDGQTVTAQGPETVQPSELAEYKFSSLAQDQAYSAAQVNMQCSNCG